MLKVGFVGWRGMVGSVLMERMRAENDFKHFDFFFFSTSQIGRPAPQTGHSSPPVEDAHNIEKLNAMDIVVSCQGGDYTIKIYPQLRQNGW